MLCPVCGGRLNAVWREREFVARQCLECRLILCRSATKVPFEKHYFQHYIGQSQARQARLSHFREMVANLAVALETPILDVGAGLGFFIQALSPDLARLTTLVEPSAFARSYLRETVTAETFISLTEIPPDYPPFATVTLWDVLAHVEDPEAVLSQARQLMKKGGLLIIKTPFHPLRLFQAARLLAPIRKGHSLLHIPSMRFHFTPDSLPALLQATGFRVEARQWTSEPPLVRAKGLALLKPFLLRLGQRLVTNKVSFITLARAA